MPTVILSTATRYALPLLLLFSVFVLFRGHDDPGGGFVGGLVAAAAITLYALAEGTAAAQRILPLDSQRLIAVGLLIAALGGILSLTLGDPFMTGLWIEDGEGHLISLPLIGKLGSPLLFDLGVYLVVIGVTVTIIFNLAEES